MPLKGHLDELNFVLTKLWDIDVKLEDKDIIMILLAFVLPSYENFVSSLSVGKNYITLEEVNSILYSREHWHKVSGNSEEVPTSRLILTNYAKWHKRRKENEARRIRLIQRIFVITTRNLVIGRKIVPRK